MLRGRYPRAIPAPTLPPMHPVTVAIAPSQNLGLATERFAVNRPRAQARHRFAISTRAVNSSCDVELRVLLPTAVLT